jgi:hypothetical protein
VRAGSQGRLTPLFVDLPANEDTMDVVVVVTTGSPGDDSAVSPAVYAAVPICLLLRKSDVKLMYELE